MGDIQKVVATREYGTAWRVFIKHLVVRNLMSIFTPHLRGYTAPGNHPTLAATYMSIYVH